MKILITGGTGFVGSAMAQAFVLQDHRSRKPSLRRQALLIFKFIFSRLLSPARRFGG